MSYRNAGGSSPRSPYFSQQMAALRNITFNGVPVFCLFKSSSYMKGLNNFLPVPWRQSVCLSQNVRPMTLVIVIFYSLLTPKNIFLFSNQSVTPSLRNYEHVLTLPVTYFFKIFFLGRLFTIYKSIYPVAVSSPRHVFSVISHQSHQFDVPPRNHWRAFQVFKKKYFTLGEALLSLGHEEALSSQSARIPYSCTDALFSLLISQPSSKQAAGAGRKRDKRYIQAFFMVLKQQEHTLYALYRLYITQGHPLTSHSPYVIKVVRCVWGEVVRGEGGGGVGVGTRACFELARHCG